MALDFTETKNYQQKPRYLVILLHGYGSNAEDLISLAPNFKDVIPNSHFIAPNAPFEWEGGFPKTYQWFSLEEKTNEFVIPQMKEANKILDDFIVQQLEKTGVVEENLILMGFSQGAMMSVYNALHRPKKITAVISFSGKVFDDDLQTNLQSKPNICLIHGKEDSILPFPCMAEAEAIFEKHNIPFESHGIDYLDHVIDMRCINFARDFIRNNINS